ADTQRLAGSGDHLDRGSGGEQSRADLGGGADDVFAVVEDDQGVPSGQVAGNRVSHGCARHRFAHVQSGADLFPDELTVRERGEVDKPDPVRKLGGYRCGEPQCQPSLAGTTWAGQRQQPLVGQQPGGLGQLSRTAHEPGQGSRQVGGYGGPLSSGPEFPTFVAPTQSGNQPCPVAQVNQVVDVGPPSRRDAQARGRKMPINPQVPLLGAAAPVAVTQGSPPLTFLRAATDLRDRWRRQGERAQILRFVQPSLIGLIDRTISTLAPILATAFLAGSHTALVVGLAASLGAAISMGLSEALSDDGELSGRGSSLVRGALTGVATFVGGTFHA